MRITSALLIVILIGAAAARAEAQTQTFQVTNFSLIDYVIEGQNDPVLTLERGRSYRFAVNAPGHPFWIKTSPVTGIGSAYQNGVTGNGTDNGDVLFDVPLDAPSTLHYICQLHSTMTGRIDIINPTGVEPGPGSSSFSIVPNPARGWVRFLLPSDSRARSIDVFDPTGRLVRRFEPTFASNVTWEGRDLRGGALPSGVYLVRVQGEAGRSVTRRLLWLRR